MNTFCRILCLLTVFCVGALAGQVTLDELDTRHIATGWGKVGVNRSVSGTPLSIGGQIFEKGLGVHAVSRVRIDLQGAGQRFTARVGVDDVMRGQGRIEFIVFGDGRELWRSGLMSGGQAARPVDVALKGIQTMDLVVSDGGNGIGQDHANWAEPQLTFEGERPSIVSARGDMPETYGPPVSPCKRSDAPVALIPFPQQVVWHDGRLDLARFNVKTPRDDAPEFDPVVKALFQVLENAGCERNDGGTAVELLWDDDVKGREAYVLQAGEEGIVIRASSYAGLFYGVQTLRQLMAAGTSLPQCEIEDRPAFAWRGFMHDLGRNPQDVDLLKRFIDAMAAYKLNVFHMHLTDYPGYRIECKKYPELNKAENMRATRRPGFFYTYDQLNDIIAYCRERHIRVVPEIDMPGHSEYFKKTFGVDMQDPKGMQILSEVVTEFLDHVDLPYFHMGSDEVRVRNKAFMPHMEKLIRDRGKDILVWRPGHLPNKNAITQIWTGQARPAAGVRYLDSQANYINHMDPLVGPIRAFMQQPCRVPAGTELALGGILCHWPDNNVGEQMNVYRQSPVMPALVAYAERIWRGAQNNREDAWAKLPAADDPAFKEYAAFEADMLALRERDFEHWSFPYVQQTDLTWRLIGPFDHKGDTRTAFPVETSYREEYIVEGKTFLWHKSVARGGTIHVNHFFGFEGHLPKASPGTVYARTTIESEADQEVAFWIGFNENSRSGGRRCGPNPAQGQWSIVNAKIWVNGTLIPPPTWHQPGVGVKTPEIPFVDELYACREPATVRLRKGTNTILVKVPHGAPAWKWMFTCMPVDWDGFHVRDVEGLKFIQQEAPPVNRGFTIPQADINDREDLHVVITQEGGKYWGHPSSVLLDDNKTMVMMYLDGHARARFHWKKSFDAGLTWTEHLPVPEGWNDIPEGQKTPFREIPILYRLTDPVGKERLLMTTGVPTIRRALSEDGGKTWSDLEMLKDKDVGGIVVFADMLRLKNGSYLATMHDDGRFLRGRHAHSGFSVYKMLTHDGGLTWDDPVEIATHPVGHLCEAGLVRSPDGNRIAMLMRENARKLNSFICFSDDEGETWSEPREMPGALTGDRHQCTYTPDGRLFISFRDMGHESPTKGDWVAWVGTFEDLEQGREGQYRVRLKDNFKGGDCAYPTQHLLPDGTIFAATYGHWDKGAPAYILSVRFKIEELDAIAAVMK